MDKGNWPDTTTEFLIGERTLAWKQSENMNTFAKIDLGRVQGFGDAKGDDGGRGECH